MRCITATNVYDSINSAAEMHIMRLIPHDTYQKMFKTILTITEASLCLVIIFQDTKIVTSSTYSLESA